MLKGRTSDSEFDWKMLDNWDERNSKTQLKLDEDGKSLLLKRINEEIVEQPIYEVDNDGGKKYQELTDQINKLLNPYRNYNTGDVNPSQLPKAV
ncbi:hypothetical protein [Sharpea azabuensis]|uniref:hypothetical protein n=1 Tax=Sharpea azabuensis TaxID=322505 RepID=UPI0015680341|nr:hypothetical protein [Sharpea azabuensis]